MRPLTGTSKIRRLSAILTGSIAVLSLSACAMDQARMATLRPPPYLALNTGATPANLVRESGYFTEERGCIVFRPAASARTMTPIFPAGQTALATDGIEWLGMFVHDTPVSMGTVYRLSGAPAAMGGVTVATPIPAGCPTSYFVVGGLEDAFADNQVNRFCEGVTLCTSYKLD